MSHATFGRLLLGSFLILAALSYPAASDEALARLDYWGRLCNSPIQIEGCLQTCRGAFDPDKDYAGYTTCLEDCRIACKKDKKRGYF
jgi:hypothetical protein